MKNNYGNTILGKDLMLKEYEASKCGVPLEIAMNNHISHLQDPQSKKNECKKLNEQIHAFIFQYLTEIKKINISLEKYWQKYSIYFDLLMEKKITFTGDEKHPKIRFEINNGDLKEFNVSMPNLKEQEIFGDMQLYNGIQIQIAEYMEIRDATKGEHPNVNDYFSQNYNEIYSLLLNKFEELKKYVENENASAILEQINNFRARINISQY